MLLEIALYIYLSLTLLIFAVLLCADLYSLFARKRVGEPITVAKYAPKTLVMVPCRGMDLTLEQNLRSLKSQRYKNYSLVAIVDDESDLALKTIRKLGIKHLISSSDCVKCSGKVRAISTAMEKLRGYQAYVIVDSDVQVERNWLAALVQPLQDKKVGISTMYPYFKPLGGFWSKVKMVWGFVGDSLLERESSRFGWGGSLAFRKELMDAKSLKFFKDSNYSISDDICLTKIAKAKGLRIAYVKTPKPIVNCKESFGAFLEWSNRQTALTALGYRRNLYLGLVYYSMEIWLVLSGIILAVFVTPIFLILFLHYVKSVANAYHRSGIPSLQIPIIVLMLPFLYDINLIRASRMRTITWRGRVYQIRQ